MNNSLFGAEETQVLPKHRGVEPSLNLSTVLPMHHHRVVSGSRAPPGSRVQGPRAMLTAVHCAGLRWDFKAMP